MNQMLVDAVHILREGTNDSYQKIEMILEDAASPITKSYKEKLFQSIIDRSHIDFGDIPRSRGDITKYSGYKSLKETLDVLLALGNAEKSTTLIAAVSTVNTAIENIKKLRMVFMKGFTDKIDIIMLDYDTYTFTCVEAVTTLMHSYIDFIKTPSSPTYVLTLKDTKYRADDFFFKQLEKFNRVNVNGKYASYLTTIANKGQENFFLDGAMIVGAAAISVIALSIIPVTRELIFLFNDLKRKLSEAFSLQAYFLEMNKLTLEYNTTIKPEKKKKILERQEKLRKRYLLLADKLKISSIRAEETSKKKLDEDNNGMNTDTIEDEVNDSDFDIL